MIKSITDDMMDVTGEVVVDIMVGDDSIETLT